MQNIQLNVLGQYAAFKEVVFEKVFSRRHIYDAVEKCLEFVGGGWFVVCGGFFLWVFWFGFVGVLFVCFGLWFVGFLLPFLLYVFVGFFLVGVTSFLFGLLARSEKDGSGSWVDNTSSRAFNCFSPSVFQQYMPFSNATCPCDFQ